MILRPKDNTLSILLTAALFLLIFLLSKTIPEEQLRQFILNTGDLGPFVFILLMLLSYILSPLSGSPLLLVGFYIFRSEVVLFAAVAGFLATITNFWIARLWGKNLVRRIIGEKSVQKIEEITKNSSLFTLFFIRIFQGGIHELVSYVLGLTSIGFLPYFIVSTLAMIPGTLLWYALSLKVKNSVEFTAITLILGIVFSALLVVPVLVLGKYKTKNKEAL